jgi:hypothetical protein
MKGYDATLLVACVLMSASGCGQGAHDVDYSPSRGISADISATHDTGPTSSTRGVTTSGEPIGAIPWQLDQRH